MLRDCLRAPGAEGRAVPRLPRKRFEMAKGRTKRSGKVKKASTPPLGASTAKPSTDVSKPKAAKPASGVRKQMRRLERRLAAAAKQELRRIRKLERARHRRQVAEAALNQLRGAIPALAPDPAVSPVAPASPKPPAKPRAAARAKPRTAAGSTAGKPSVAAGSASTTATRPRTARPVQSPRRTAAKPPAGRAARPAGKTASAPAEGGTSPATEKP